MLSPALMGSAAFRQMVRISNEMASDMARVPCDQTMRRWDDDLSDIHDNLPAMVGSIEGLTRGARQVVAGTAAGATGGDQVRRQCRE